MTLDIDKDLETYHCHPVSIAHRAMLEVTEAAARRLAKEGISKKELARRAGLHQAAVTRFLSGEQNCTMLTLAKIAAALGCSEFRVKFAGSQVDDKLKATREKRSDQRGISDRNQGKAGTSKGFS
jgi:transcriptional regulator with XRE-family HTH domain